MIYRALRRSLALTLWCFIIVDVNPAVAFDCPSIVCTFSEEAREACVSTLVPVHHATV